jgi:hypothetical protein
MPTSTDLVTDLPADFEVFGQAVDTDFVDLLGGTTGQILSKATNADMDFTWITNDVGDITAVTAGTGISGGGTSGAVTITNSMATTITTAGDVIYGTGSGTFTRLGIGSTGNVLTVAGGVPTWAAPAGGGKVLQVVSAITTTATTIATTSMTDTTITATITPTSASSQILVLINGVLTHGINSAGSGVGGQLMRGASIIQGYASAFIDLSAATGATRIDRYARIPIIYMDSPATTSATTYKLQGRINDTANSGTSTWQASGYGSSIVLMEIGA